MVLVYIMYLYAVLVVLLLDMMVCRVVSHDETLALKRNCRPFVCKTRSQFMETASSNSQTNHYSLLNPRSRFLRHRTNTVPLLECTSRTGKKLNSFDVQRLVLKVPWFHNYVSTTIFSKFYIIYWCKKFASFLPDMIDFIHLFSIYLLFSWYKLMDYKLSIS